MRDYSSFFNSETAYNEFLKTIEEVVINQKVINKSNIVVDSGGYSMTFATWSTRFLRTAIANDLLDNTFSVLQSLEHDLVFSSYLLDSSKLCINFQNKIFSVSGKNEKYGPLEPALWRGGGGLIHPNCRHSIDPYFPGYTELEENTVSDKQVTKNQENRDEWLYNNRNYKKYKKKAFEQDEIGLDSSKNKAKAEEWLRRRDSGPNPLDSAFDLV